MAFVNIPKDLSRIKTKVALNLTKRQLLCFGTAVSIGIPTYFFTRGAIGNSPAVLLMMAIMLPLFLLAMYEKDGQPAEKILRNYIRTKIYWAGTRPYKTENLYEILEMEGKSIATENTSTAKTAVGKRPAGKGKSHGRKKIRAKRKK
ncbi:MAG: PrgI family protein [Firmicutes bacterium]|nr:PrgI family protein [Bacillota bacterium]